MATNIEFDLDSVESVPGASQKAQALENISKKITAKIC